MNRNQKNHEFSHGGKPHPHFEKKELTNAGSHGKERKKSPVSPRQNSEQTHFRRKDNTDSPYSPKSGKPGPAYKKRSVESVSRNPRSTAGRFRSDEERPQSVFQPVNEPSESFSDIFFRLAKLPEGTSPAGMEYNEEVSVKKHACEKFFTAHAIACGDCKFIPSPEPRHYRTTSKRKVSISGGHPVFSMGYSLKHESGESVAGAALMEVELHGQIYAAALDILSKKHYSPLAHALNFVIIRGTRVSAAVVMNLWQISGTIVHKLKMFAAELQSAVPAVASVFMFLDESRSDYYFDSFRPHAPVDFKRICGTSMVPLKMEGKPVFLYPPTVFSQVNESILPEFTSAAMDLAGLSPAKRFIDLYCGYGLFSFCAAPYAGEVIGMDFEGPAIRAARANAEHLFPDKNLSFDASVITAETLRSRLPFSGTKKEVILLDPPRNGTESGVIGAISDRAPERVIAVYCSADQMAREVRIWNGCGFQVRKIRIFDMFPGSPNIETMLLLSR